MSVKTTVKSFVREFVAKVQGDDATALAEKAFRQAQSAIKTQISVLEGDTVGKEDAVSDAIEKLASARINNGKPITDRAYYVETLLQAKNAVTTAEAAKELHEKKIAFLKEQLTSLETEVEAELEAKA